MKVRISVLLIAGVLLLVLPPSLVQGKQRPGLELVLYYPFDEGGGRTVEDKSETEADGKLIGAPEWVDGKFGGALRFNHDGVNNDEDVVVREGDHVSTRESERLAFSSNDPITIMAWIYGDQWDNHDNAIVYNWPEGQGTQANYGFRIEQRAEEGDRAGDVALFYRDAADADWHRVTSREPVDGIPLREWHHVAGTMTPGIPENQVVYWNGEKLPVAFSHGNGKFKAVESDGPVHIAARGWAPGARDFRGRIDEVSIWRGIFTEDELKEIAQTPTIEFLSVEPQGKLATSWGALKRGRR